MQSNPSRTHPCFPDPVHQDLIFDPILAGLGPDSDVKSPLRPKSGPTPEGLELRGAGYVNFGHNHPNIGTRPGKPNQKMVDSRAGSRKRGAFPSSILVNLLVFQGNTHRKFRKVPRLRNSARDLGIFLFCLGFLVLFWAGSNNCGSQQNLHWEGVSTKQKILEPCNGVLESRNKKNMQQR